MHWPSLRDEIDIFEGPKLNNGQPSWVLHDPVRQQFFRIDWLTFEILSRWALGSGTAIVASIEQDTPLDVDAEDIQKALTFLADNQLLRIDGAEDVQKLTSRKLARKSQWWQWLIHHYLFFRVPLFKPDKWLEKMAPLSALCFSASFLWLSLGALLLGLYQVMRQWDSFYGFVQDTLTAQGLLAFGLAVIASQVLHELGHAFTLKRYGGRVPTMGVAFLVLWPMAYTDTNEAWKIANRRQRLLISSSGIATETLIAAWALLGWALMPDGSLRSALFYLASASLGVTLAINANPFMRFDGYFILCDWLDIPNLHQRSFALARWQLRRWLFGLEEPVPEYWSRPQHAALVAFAWSVWVYRLILFIGIALLVYHLFTKLLGVLLFAIEIYWFIWFPVRSELKEWWKRKSLIVQSVHSRRTAVAAVVLIGLFVIPLPTRMTVTALLKPADIWPIYSPGPATLQGLKVQHGQHVEAGQLLLQLKAPDLLLQNNLSQARWQRLQWQASVASVTDAQAYAPLALSISQLQAAKAEVDRIRQQQIQYEPRAPFAGRFILTDPDLAVGQWVVKNESIGAVVGPKSWQLETWVSEEQAQRLQVGDSAVFITPGIAHPLNARVSLIEEDATRTLQEGMLSAAHGGHVLVREQQGRLIPEQSHFRVSLALEEPFSPQMLTIYRGQLSLMGKAESVGGRYVRYALAVLIREFRP